MCSVILCALIVNAMVGVVNSLSLEKLVANDQKCGVEASTNLLHHNPWMVFIEYYRGERRTVIRCGATLIDSKHVITAAHCVQKVKYTKLVARLGEYDLDEEKDCLDGVCADPVVRLDVADIFIHPGYDGTENDIAVLRLKEDAPYTDFIRPICLPSGKIDGNVTFSAAGWGEIPVMGYYSHVKKIVPLPYWTREDCQAAYNKATLAQNVICAGGEEGIDTCRGDSGGPLTWFRDRFELWGVTSSGNVHCGQKGYPGIYTSVVDYLDWINSVIN